MKKILMAAAALTLLITIAIPITSCNKKDKMDIVIDLDSIVIKPYVNFGTKLAKVEKYMAENYADYSDENPNSLDYIELEGGALWGKYYKKGTHEISFYFINANGKDLTMVSYDFYSLFHLKPSWQSWNVTDSKTWVRLILTTTPTSAISSSRLTRASRPCHSIGRRTAAAGHSPSSPPTISIYSILSPSDNQTMA